MRQLQDAFKALGFCAKQKHRSEGAAEAHLRAIHRKHEPDGEPLESYHCRRCGWWHVGRPKPFNVRPVA